MKSQVKYDFSKLHKFVTAIGTKSVVRVGIFGEKNTRNKKKGDGPTNAELGAIHEFGSPSQHIPPRSFLRMPISRESNRILRDASQGAEKLIAAGKFRDVLVRLGIAAEDAVLRAFDIGGPGWAPDKQATARAKGSYRPLIDTGQLRRSITSKVVDK